MQGVLDQVLALGALHLEPGRERKGPLDEMVIEERHACLQAGSHGQPVNLGQHLADQRRAHIGVELARQLLVTVRFVEVKLRDVRGPGRSPGGRQHRV